MANRYTVTMQLMQDQFVDFMNTVGPAAGSMRVTVTPDPNEVQGEPAPIFEPRQAAPAPHQAARAPRHRVSRVNGTILGALQDGSKTIGELKQALEAAGFAPTSLSTGLAILQKSGEVERAGSGVYTLKQAQEAAE